MPSSAMFPTRFLSHPNMLTAAQLRKTSTGPLHLFLALSTLPERAFSKCKSDDAALMFSTFQQLPLPLRIKIKI